MKKKVKSYISFTRMEQIGLISIFAMLILLIAIRASMFLWVHPAIDAEKNKRLAAAWETFKNSQRTNDSGIAQKKNDYLDAFDDNETALPEIIDINTVDSATLIRLKGIGPVTAGKIVARRKNIGPFTNIDQLLEIRHFPDATYKILKEHLQVGTAKPDN